MKSSNITVTVLVVVIGLVSVLIWWWWPAKPSLAPTINQPPTNTATNVNTAGGNSNSVSMVEFSTADLPDRDPNFTLTMNIPKNWEVEYDKNISAINIYDAQSGGLSNIVDSQLLVQYYTGAVRQPAHLTIGSLVTKQINSRAAREYTITADPIGARPAGFPEWWLNSRTVLELRQTVGSEINYQFNFAPTVDPTTRTALSSSIKLE